ncbi:MAG TPA: L,D-transpeptidase family protein [Acidobacteriota bacterium]|nr:L,D-transpeptidase family protein [Acidobacteriota bacterium]
MKQAPSRLLRLWLVTWLAGIGASALASGGCAPPAARDTAEPARDLVRSARHSDLKWPEFPDLRAEIERLYERASWRSLWLRDGRPTEAAIGLIARLAAAESLGLEAADYDATWLDQEARAFASGRGSPAPERLSRFDVGLSVAAVRLVSALHRGRVSPRAVQAQLFIPRPSLAVEMAVDSLRHPDLQGPVLDRLQPRLLHYQLLKNVLVRMRRLARDTTLVPLPALPALVKPGMRLGAAVPLRRLLEATGDLDRGARPKISASGHYTPDLVAAVKRFQRRHGFEPDGVLGPATAAALNRPFARRVRQIELALERFRWLPVSFTVPPIIVNIPAFRLYVFRGAIDREEDMIAMDVVVGEAFDKRTPVFAAALKHVVFRPYWEVPAGIMKTELIPRALADKKFLQRERMVLVSGDADDAPVLPPTRENLARIGADLRLRQLPGPENALGLVKFLLPNAHDVYLHDTAAKGLFSRARRDMSHGCVRLSDPVALAGHLLRDRPEWTVERIRQAMDGDDDNRMVTLTRPVPVCIVYATAIARENGEVHFYPDIYGLDGELDRLLRAGYPYPK